MARERRHGRRRAARLGYARDLRHLRRAGGVQGGGYAPPFDTWRVAQPTECIAPSSLSIVDTPDETLKFMNELLEAKKRGSTIARLDAVTTISHDAIVALLAIGPERGRLPLSQATRAQLLASGFLNFVKVKGWSHRASQGHIVRQPINDARVQPLIAERAVAQVQESLPNSPDRALYSMLIECMGNTDNHARESDSSSPARWWVSTNRLKSGSVAVTFLDMGVGILTTAVRKGWFRTLSSSGKRLEDVLLGRVGSSTELAHRGKGLPEIAKKSRESSSISRLVVVANDGHFDVLAGQHKTLKHPLSGTLLYWEINDPSLPSPRP